MIDEGAKDIANNDDQIAYWNAATGEKWVALQAGLDSFLRRPLEQLLRRATPVHGERVLDIGCGAGTSTLALAKIVGSAGSAVGVDISRPLLDRAEQLREHAQIPNTTFLLADAQVHPFQPKAFDVVISRFGVMFFAAPVVAFQNISKALKPGGRIAFVSWAPIAQNPWFNIARDIAIKHLGNPSPADPRAPGPFAFADLDYVHGVLSDAGFADYRGEPMSVVLEFDGTVEVAASIITNVGAANRIIREFDAAPEIVQQIEHDITSEIQQFVRGDCVQIPSVVNYFSAVNQ